MAVPTSQFVKVGSDIGKLVEIKDESAVVEFFEAPVPGGYQTVDVPLALLKPVPFLELQTRVWFEEDGQWRCGRVVSRPEADETTYFIALPEKRNAEVEPARLNVRWSRRLVDPVRMLEAKVADSRFDHANRSAFVQEVLRHRAVVQGLVGISSSSVRLHPHQVLAARRILRDPVRRYLLADEVGLGKTIEAGMVVRQMMLETASTRVVAAVPAQLVAQWEDELASKFYVNGLNGGWVDVISHEQLINGAWRSEGEPDVLIIDEAHRIVDESQADNFPLVCEVAHLAPALLLLSATPARTNEEAFLRMLHLLDPISYRVDDLDSFRERVRSRDEIGGALTLLNDPDGSYLYDEAIEKLLVPFKEDQHLQVMADEVLDAVGAEDDLAAADAAQILRNYVSDTYRLHRRMIRTRREGEVEDELPIRGREWAPVRTVVDNDPRRTSIVSALDSFRQALVNHPELQPDRTIRVVAARCSSSLHAVRELVRLLTGGDLSSTPSDEREAIDLLSVSALGANLAEDLEAATEGGEPDGRLVAMVDWAESHIGKRKVVALTSYTEVGRAAFSHAVDRFGAHRVAALLSDMTTAELECQYWKVKEDELCNVLVCDAVAEEGWNLQFADQILHLDLPWSVNRLEQRIGRFDRFTTEFGRLGPIRSAVCVDVDKLSVLTGAWLEYLDVAFGIFDRSTAALQFAVPESEFAAVNLVLDQGFSALREFATSEGGSLLEVRRAIAHQDVLDAVESDREERRFFARLISLDRSAEALGTSTADWIGKSLNFRRREEGASGWFSVEKRNPPLLTESEVHSIGVPLLNNRYVVNRPEVGRSTGQILRPGNELLDNFYRFTESDGRATCFALVKEIAGRPEGSSVLPVFYFDLYVEPSTEFLSGMLVGADSARTRAIDYLSPRLEPIWIMHGSGEPSEGAIKTLGSILAGKHDGNLAKSPELFAALTAGIDWSATCREAERNARGAVLQRPRVLSDAESALERLDADEKRMIAIGRARERFLDESFDAGVEREFFGAVRTSVSDPKVSTVSCGVVFLVAPGTIARR